MTDVRPDHAPARDEPVMRPLSPRCALSLSKRLSQCALSLSEGAISKASTSSAHEMPGSRSSPSLTCAGCGRRCSRRSRASDGSWILLSQNAQVAELRNDTLLLAMANAGARDSFGRGGSEDVLREAIVVVLGADFKIETMVDPGAPSPPSPARMPPQAEPAPAEPARHDERDAAASRDDTDLDDASESPSELLARHLGAEFIAEEERPT